MNSEGIFGHMRLLYSELDHWSYLVLHYVNLIGSWEDKGLSFQSLQSETNWQSKCVNLQPTA